MMGRATQNLDSIKFVELLSVELKAAPIDMLHQTVEYRHKALQSKLALTQASLADVYALVRLLFSTSSTPAACAKEGCMYTPTKPKPQVPPCAVGLPSCALVRLAAAA